MIQGLGIQEEFPLMISIYNMSFRDILADKDSFLTAMQKAISKSGKLSEAITEGTTTL